MEYHIYDKFPDNWRDDSTYTVLAGGKLIQFINKFNDFLYIEKDKINNREQFIDSWFLDNLDSPIVIYSTKPIYYSIVVNGEIYYIRIDRKYKLLKPHSIELIK